MKQWVLVAVLLTAAVSCKSNHQAPAATAAPSVPARVLFDGAETSGWKHRDGTPIQWKVVEGALEVAGGGDIVSKQKFQDCIIHIEFMIPVLPDDVKGQDRGNSGVYVQGRYEVQVLDSYGLQSGHGDCGAIYAIKAPDHNACKPPGQWQAYDITFRAARFDDSGKKIENARITVVQNGVTVQDDLELPRGTPGGLGGESPEPGPILLQDHASPVRYRNIRVVPIPPPSTQAALLSQHFKDLRPGLVGEYFRDIKNLDELNSPAKPFLVRIDKQIRFDRVHGQFYDTKLNNNFAVRWSGVLRIVEPGSYELGLWSDDKSRLWLNDQLVVDNTKPGDPGASGFVELTTGDYPIRIEYHQGAGAAEFSFSRHDPYSGGWDPFPEAQLLHLKSQEDVGWDMQAWNAAVWDRNAWMRDFGPKFMKMDYGPFLSHTIIVNSDQTVNKGLAIQLGKPDEAAVLFDTELLRFAAGWTGGFLKYEGVAFGGEHGANPSIPGQTVFITKPQPGWSSSIDFADPRPQGLGNLPGQRGHYKGIYRSGERVVLAYLIGNREVLDMPIFVRGEQPAIRRVIEVGPGDRDIWLNLDQDSDGLRIPASNTSTIFVVEHANEGIRRVQTAEALLSPSEFCNGGPARWPEPIVTKGTLGTGDGPYVVDTITVPEDNPWHAWLRFGGLDFFSDGRAALCTWSGDVWIVSGIDDRLESVKWKRFAAGMFQPLGLRVVDDKVYVLGRDQITRLYDLNGDGEADFYENFNNDCIVTSSFHEFALDLQTDPEGNFYFAKGGAVRQGGRGWERITEHHGCILRVSKDGSTLDVFATGVRAPNGMGSGPRGEISVSDNEGTWTPACRVSFVKKGGFLGVVDLAHQETKPTTFEPPIYWLPHEEVDNSSGGQVWVTSDRWGPLKGRMLHLSYGMCSLSLVLLDEVEGVAQGGIVKFPDLDFDTGICRARFREQDGQLYVTGLRGWQTRAAKDGALQRVRYTGKPVYMPCDMEIGPGRITIGFTCELDPELVADKDSYNIQQWNYIWSSDYGSPEVTLDDPNRRARDPVEIESVSVSEENRSITLYIPKLRPVMQMKIQMKLEAKDGTPVEFDIYNTINRIPSSK